MDEDKKLMNKKLSQLWSSTDVKVLETAGQKYVIMSDSHIGDGGSADDLHTSKNRETLIRALVHYKNKGFKLILLGDIEELWQFDFEQIVKEYGKDIYAKIRAFGKNRVYRVFGNHDLDWHFQDPTKEKHSNSGWAVEALKMKDKDGNTRILLVHGHQGSVLSGKYAWLSRIFVRKIWTRFEPLAVKLGLFGNPSSTRSQIVKNYEKILYSWAKEKKIILICGHSHRAIFASKSYIDILKNGIRKLQSDILAHHDDKKRVRKNIKKIEELTKKLASEKMKGREISPTERYKTPLPCFFNCGCTLYTDGMTAIEIENDIVRLVKWHRKPKKGQFFKIYEDGNGKTLSDFIQTVKKSK